MKCHTGYQFSGGFPLIVFLRIDKRIFRQKAIYHIGRDIVSATD
jgi:hypothetical protein